MSLTLAERSPRGFVAYDICMRPWRYAVEPFCIAGNLYYVGNRDVSAHLIDTGEGLILLDSTFPQTAYLLLESIRRLGFDPDDIRYILHSHGHYDHVGGTRAVVELTGAKSGLGAADIEIITRRPELTWAPEYGVEFYETFDVDLPLQDGQVVSLGHTAIECVATPGHTPGCMSYFFTIRERDCELLAGIHGGPGLNPLTDEYLARYGLLTDGRKDYLRSLYRLQQRQVDIFIGAHPAQNGTLDKRTKMQAGANPFLDRQAWPTYLASLEREARGVLAGLQPGGR